MSPVIFYLLSVLAMGWQLPRVREKGERRGAVLWMLLWLVALALGSLYFYGAGLPWLADWRLA